MDSFFKKLLNTGMGAASKITRFSAEMINELVETGKISEEEGKSILDDLEREGKLQQQEMENEFKIYLEKMIKNLDIPTREDLKNLENRVDILERSMPGAVRID